MATEPLTRFCRIRNIHLEQGEGILVHHAPIPPEASWVSLAEDEEGPTPEPLSDLFGGLDELLILYRLPFGLGVWIVEEREPQEDGDESRFPHYLYC